MKIGIIYYSRTGNTRQVAHLLEKKLLERNQDVDVIEIEAVKKPGFFTTGYAAMKQKTLPIKNEGVDLAPYDTLLVGTPTWGRRPSPFIKTFFQSAQNTRGKKAAMFIIRGGDPDKRQTAQEIMKKTLEGTGLNVADAFLCLQMKKGVIRKGEENIDSYLTKVLPL
ncbi:MAG: flavodoxin family protein [Methanobacteriota archaeon]